MYANEQPRQSKRSMLAQLREQPVKAKLAARNTLDYTLPGGVRMIRLHQTDILVFEPNGNFLVNTGGWNTHTTRARINEFLPAGYRVHTTKGIAYLNNTPFQEVVRVRSGTIHSDVMPDEGTRLTKQIDAYTRKWRKKGLPTAEESGGNP